jgi:DnaJ-class molecular chaperone
MTEISVTIIEKYDKYTVVECARCGGNGRMCTYDKSHAYEYEDCDCCGSAGKVKISSTPPFSECGRCSGTGDICPGGNYDYDTKTCPTCEGTGLISDDNLKSY